MKSNGLWAFITAVVVALIVSGSAVFIGIQYNKTQVDIANINAKAQDNSATKINDGLNDIGQGLCQTGTRQFLNCN